MSPSWRERLQFSLGGLAVFTAACAFGALAARWEGGDWSAGVLGAVAFYFACGLAQQIRDLWIAPRTLAPLDREERWGRRLAIAWRCGAIGVIGLYYVFSGLAAEELIRPSTSEYQTIFGVGPSARNAALGLVLVAVIGSIPRTTRRIRPPSPFYTFIGVLGFVAGGIWCSLVVFELTPMTMLTYVAVVGVDIAALSIPQAVTLGPNQVRLQHVIFVESATVVALGIGAAIVTWRLACVWRQGGSSRYAWGVAASVLIAMGCFRLEPVVRNFLPELSPECYEAAPGSDGFDRLTGAVLAMSLVTAFAVRWCRDRDDVSLDKEQRWRPPGRVYWHERRFVLAALATAYVGSTIQAIWEMIRDGYLFGGGMLDMTWRYLMIYSLADPSILVGEAVTLAALAGIFAREKPELEAQAAALPRIAPGLFATVWLALAAIVVTTIPALALAAVMVWFEL